MAQMIQYQHAYDAAARVLTVADEMLGTIIEQMGVH
jgi:flagellar hook-associated protein FlgK